MMNVAVVGCGLVGHKRARALQNHRLVAVADVQVERARQLADQYPGCTAYQDWQEVVCRADVDLVIVATTHDALVPVSLGAVRCGKHVLVEKPAARHPRELAELASAIQTGDVLVKVGFNHRFHPAFVKARALFDSGAIGELMYIRGRYGHGGRLGYEKEWRANPRISGGGELLDQGVHLIDLARWFAGDFTEVSGYCHTYFWDMPVEDNAFALLKTPKGQVAWLHASWTEWKNLFCFEIFGGDGKLQIDGLGGSYGPERLTFYRMLPAMGPPETTICEYPGEDTSWRDEFEHFVRCIEQGGTLWGNLQDARAALEIVFKLYGGIDR